MKKAEPDNCWWEQLQPLAINKVGGLTDQLGSSFVPQKHPKSPQLHSFHWWAFQWIIHLRSPWCFSVIGVFQHTGGGAFFWESVLRTWNPNDLYFWRSSPQNKAFSNQNKGHLGSRYIISVIFSTWVVVTFRLWKLYHFRHHGSRIACCGTLWNCQLKNINTSIAPPPNCKKGRT